MAWTPQVSEHFRIVQKLGEGTYGKAVFAVLRTCKSKSSAVSGVQGNKPHHQ